MAMHDFEVDLVGLAKAAQAAAEAVQTYKDKDVVDHVPRATWGTTPSGTP